MNANILIVEDDKDLSQIYAEILEMNGYNVIKANDGVEAIIVYKQHLPDLVFMDVDMPNMDGLDASSKILEFDKNAKIVIITGYSEVDNRVNAALQNGIISIISKPMSIDLLLDTAGKFIHTPLEKT